MHDRPRRNDAYAPSVIAVNSIVFRAFSDLEWISLRLTFTVSFNLQKQCCLLWHRDSFEREISRQTASLKIGPSRQDGVDNRRSFGIRDINTTGPVHAHCSSRIEETSWIELMIHSV